MVIDFERALGESLKGSRRIFGVGDSGALGNVVIVAADAELGEYWELSMASGMV